MKNTAKLNKLRLNVMINELDIFYPAVLCFITIKMKEWLFEISWPYEVENSDTDMTMEDTDTTTTLQ